MLCYFNKLVLLPRQWTCECQAAVKTVKNDIQINGQNTKPNQKFMRQICHLQTAPLVIDNINFNIDFRYCNYEKIC